jgi:hypothetical protein
MLRAPLITLLVVLATAPSASAARCTPPAEPGLVVAVCSGEASVSGPAGGPVAEYRDADPGRLDDVRLTGRGTPATVYVARFTVDGLLMEGTLTADELPDGMPLRVILELDFALLETENGGDEADAQPRLRRVLRSPRTRLSESSAQRTSSACLAFRRDVTPSLFGFGEDDPGRALSTLRRARERFARRLLAAGAVRADRARLRPLARALRAGNRHLLAAERRIRRSGDANAGARQERAFRRTLPREQRLRRRLGMTECSA